MTWYTQVYNTIGCTHCGPLSADLNCVENLVEPICVIKTWSNHEILQIVIPSRYWSRCSSSKL